MAQDQVEVMRELGFSGFAVVGHDRGGRVAHRMALDHPQRVTRVALLDIVPTLTVYTHGQQGVSPPSYFHWFFLIQPAPLPETLLARPRGARSCATSRSASLIPGAIPEAVFAEYLRCFADPATLHAMCEDYRAGASIDLEHDQVDLDAQDRLPDARPVGRARRDASAVRRRWQTWRERATMVYGKALPAGHWLPEECPEEVSAACVDFLSLLQRHSASGRAARSRGVKMRKRLEDCPRICNAAVLLPSGSFAMHSHARFVAGLLLAATCSCRSP